MFSKSIGPATTVVSVVLLPKVFVYVFVSVISPYFPCSYFLIHLYSGHSFVLKVFVIIDTNILLIIIAFLSILRTSTHFRKSELRPRKHF